MTEIVRRATKKKKKKKKIGKEILFIVVYI